MVVKYIKVTILTMVMMMVGVIFSSTKIKASEVTDNVSIYYGTVVNDIILEVYNLSFEEFVEEWKYSANDNSQVIIHFNEMYVEYDNSSNGISYLGDIDSIILKKYDEDNYNLSFYNRGELKISFNRQSIVPLTNPFVYIRTLVDDMYNQGKNYGYEIGKILGEMDGYGIGYDKGYDDGKKVSSDEAYEDGQDLGKIIGMQQYGIYYNGEWLTAQQYGMIKFNDGVEAHNDFSFIGLLTQVFVGMGSILAIELLPNITIGAIIAVPIVFGIIYFILGKKRGD